MGIRRAREPVRAGTRGALVGVLALTACNALTGVDDIAVGDGADAASPPADADAPLRDAAGRVDSGGSDAGPGPDSGNPDGDVPTEGGADASTRKRVFVSAATTTGELGGLAGADAKCNQYAQAANLGGTWVAWLSRRENGSVNARDRITAAGPWYLTTGTLAVTRAQLSNPPITSAIRRTETGAAAPQGVLAWTGTNSSGTSSGEECKGWLSAAGTEDGNAGTPTETNSLWTSTNKIPCSGVASLYCFQND